jgi:hypothetical protein
MPRNMRRLTSLPGRLHAESYSGPVPPYKQIHMHAVNAVFPAHQINSIWHFYEDDLPAIATALGLTRTVPPRQNVTA